VNHGTFDTTGVSLTLQLPPSVTLVGVSTTQGSCAGTGPIDCSLGALASGAAATCVFDAEAIFTLGGTATASTRRPSPLP
jgi:hypothetical protein